MRAPFGMSACLLAPGSGTATALQRTGDHAGVQQIDLRVTFQFAKQCALTVTVVQDIILQIFLVDRHILFLSNE